jgi:hypothetical protein
MSQFASRVGDLLHLHWFARSFFSASKTLVQAPRVFEGRREGTDRGVAADRLHPQEGGVESLEGLDETILYLP